MFECIDRTFLMTDLDGTLLTSDKRVSEKDAAAIARFRDDGGRFAFATGRTLQTAMQYIEELQIEAPVILYNGAGIYDPKAGKMLYTAPLPEKAKDYTKQFLEQFPEVGAEILRPDGTYIIKLNEVERAHAAYCSVPPIYCTLDEVPEGEWLKVLFAMPEKELEALIAYANEGKFEGVSFIRSEAVYYEMLPENISKGSALEVCRTLLKAEGLSFAAAGDYHNDVEMLRRADFGAAPASAQQIVRKAADYVLTATNDEGAIAELISVLYAKGNTK